jgi:hypothetical protein
MSTTKPDEKVDPSKIVLKPKTEPTRKVTRVNENDATKALAGVTKDDEDGPSTQEQLTALKKDRTEAHLLQLVGGTITHLIQREDPDLGKIYGLAIKSEFSQHGDINVIAWIMADPEGNGPGYLDIVDGE